MLLRTDVLAFDTGKDDRGIAASLVDLDAILKTYAIDHFFEIYDGNHTNHVGDRIEQHVLPFFSRNLQF